MKRASMRSVMLLLLAAGAMAVTACQPLPYDHEDQIPEVVALEDGSAERAEMNARVYDAVMRTVVRNFYDRTFNGVDFEAEVAARRAAVIAARDEVSFYAGLEETLALLSDGHTNAVSPTDNLFHKRRRLETAPTFGIVELTVRVRGSGEVTSYVSKIRKGSTAEAAGVRPGWKFLTIDGRPWDAPQEWGDTVDGRTFVVRFEDADGRIHTRTMESKPMPREIGTVSRRPDGVLVLQFSEFDAASADWFEERLREAEADPPVAIVLDLRGNVGGEVTAGERIVGGLFREPVVFARRREFFGEVAHRSKSSPAVWDGPLVVVQSGLSGSMAEVFSATIRERRRGRVVGQKSNGSVVGATSFKLPDGGQLSVGIVEIRTGSGAILEKRGVEPDIFVEPTLDEVRLGRDTMLETAVRAALAGQRS